MSDSIPPPPASPTSNPASVSSPPPSSSSGPTINIGDEFGTAKRNLPPAKILLIAIGAVLVVVLIGSFLRRAKPQGSGSLDHVTAVSLPGDTSTMAALTFTLKNGEKPLYVHDIHGTLKTSGGEFTAEAVSAIDFDRYFQAFPDLKEGVQPALTPETKLQPGDAVTRTAIVVFPVSLDSFKRRESVSVAVQPYDETVPIVMSK
jgi:hypothetical protein